MVVSVGTFNLNNLFSRFNFRGVVGERTDEPDIAVIGAVEVAPPAPPPAAAGPLSAGRFTPPDPAYVEYRTYRGRLVEGKPEEETVRVAERIREMDVDVLGLQEVEDLPTLRRFLSTHLSGLYPYSMLIEGRDPRLIDVAIISKLPLGGLTSWQQEPWPLDPTGRPVFSRDCLDVEVLSPTRSRRLFTVYVNHLKSKFTTARTPEERELADRAASDLRRRQAETVVSVVERRQRPNSSMIVLGDMNDSPGSDAMEPFRDSFTDALTAPVERGGSPNYRGRPPGGTAWTHRYAASGSVDFELFDQIWLSPALAPKQRGAFILRRTKLTGDGTDHDPSWIKLEV